MVSESFEVILVDDQWSRHIHHQLRLKAAVKVSCEGAIA